MGAAAAAHAVCGRWAQLILEVRMLIWMFDS
jgi:hypothetical protein